MRAPRPCLWFDGKAEEAARFYVSLMPGSSIESVVHAPTNTPGNAAGDVMLVNFTLGGAPYAALNGGPHFSFTPAVSIVVPCEDQGEVDRLWDALLDGGSAMECGWLTDRYGLSWQIVPERLLAMLTSPETERVARAFAAMMTMVKLDLSAIEAAWAG